MAKRMRQSHFMHLTAHDGQLVRFGLLAEQRVHYIERSVLLDPAPRQGSARFFRWCGRAQGPEGAAESALDAVDAWVEQRLA